MKIDLKTGGLLGKYLPAGSARNRAELEVEEGWTCEDVMRELGMPLDDSYLTSLNGAVLPKAERTERRLSDGDRLAIMPPLKGG